MTINEAKNAALGILVASIITDDGVVIDNLPDVRDISVLLEAVQEIGARADRIDRHAVKVNGSNIGGVPIDDEYIRWICASYYFIGVLLGGYKSTQVPLPGGCNIDSRPIGQHTKGFRTLGTKVATKRGAIIAHTIDLVASHIYLDAVSVGAAISITMAAALAEGQTIPENATKEPYIVNVADFLNSTGANIKGADTDTIRIRGVNRLHSTEYSIVPDQIEAGTFMYAAAAARDDIMVKNVIPEHLEAISAKLTEVSCKVIEFDDVVRVVGKPAQRHTGIKTLPYPNFPTNTQPQMSVALVLANGTSMVTKSIFENRFKYVDELTRMDSNIKVEDSVAVIDGVKGLTGVQVNTPDLRTGAVLVTTGLAAGGYAVTDEIGYVQYGYEYFEEKLQGLGAMIEKADSDREIQKFELGVG